MNSGIIHQAVEVTLTEDIFNSSGQLYLPFDILKTASGFKPKAKT